MICPDTRSNSIYPSQFAVLAFISAVCFKIVMLPQYFAGTCGKNAWLAMLTCMFAEGLCLAAVYAVVTVTDLRSLPTAIPVKKALFALIAFSCFAKSLLFVGETTSYCSTTLFDEGLWRLILAGLIPVLMYVAYKGGNVLARTSQIIIWIVAVVVVFNVIFADPTGSVKNILPISYGKDVFFACDKYSAWFGDFTPLLFFRVQKKTKYGGKTKIIAPVLISYVLILVFTVGTIMAFTAVYGGGGILVSNAFSKLAIFNKLSALLGTVDFPVVCAWLLMSIIKLGLLVTGTVEGIYSFTGNRKAVTFIVCIVLGALTFFGIQNQKNIHNIMTGWIRYVVTGIDYAVPFVALACIAYYRRKIKNTGEAALELR